MQDNSRSPKAPLILQLNMVRGRPQEDGPFIRVHTLRESGEPAYLFIVAEADGPQPEETCTRVTEGLIQHFSGGPPSSTGRLQEALKRVHEGLLVENYRSLPEERVTVGVVCAYLRSPDLYLGYTGPTVAYLIGPHQGRCLAPVPGDPVARLGSPKTQQIWTRRHRLLPEETLLLATSQLLELADTQFLLASFRKRLEGGMAEVYRAATGTHSFAALAIAPRLQWTEVSPSAQASVPRPLIEEEVDYDPPMPRERPLPWRGIRPPLPTSRPWEPIPALDLGLALSSKLPQRYPGRFGQGSLFRPVVLALGGLFLLGGLFAGTQALMENINQRTLAQADALVQQAQSLWAQAQEASSKGIRRVRLTEASTLLQEAQLKAPERAGVTTLARQVQEALDALNAVQPLRDLRLVADLPALLGRSVLLRDPVVQQDRLYLLDKLENQVLELPLAAAQGGGARTIVTSLLPPRGKDQSRLTKLVWLPSGGQWPRNSLLVLDESRSLIEVTTPNVAQQLPLRGTQAWTSFQTARGANGALYILDPKGDQVLRHVPAFTGFDIPTRATPANLDLEDTIDFYVDTSIYLLSRKGQVVKATGGEAQPLSLDGLDQPLSSPLGIVSAASTKNLYVLDGSNKRIVVIRKEDGAFIRQHPLNDLPPLYALWLDQERGRLVLIGDSQVYSALVPAE